MMHSKDLRFSFSGLKTAVRYALEKEKEITPDIQERMAREFEDCVVDVLVYKSKQAIEKYNPATFILAGGVSANTYLRDNLSKLLEEYQGTTYLVPEHHLSTDNATMIALAAFIAIHTDKKPMIDFSANGNLLLSDIDA